MTSKQRKWQLKKQELGLCTICGKAAASHKGYCDVHYAAVLERTRTWYRDHGGRERKKQYNLTKKYAAEHQLHLTDGNVAVESELDKATNG